MKKHKTREVYHFHFQYKTFVCPSHSTDQTRKLGQDPFAPMEPHDGFHRQ